MDKTLKRGVKGCVHKGSFPTGTTFFASKNLFSVLYYQGDKHRTHFWQFKKEEDVIDFVVKWQQNFSQYDAYPFDGNSLTIWFPITTSKNVISPEITITATVHDYTKVVDCTFYDLLNNSFKTFDSLSEAIEYAKVRYQNFLEYEKKTR